MEFPDFLNIDISKPIISFLQENTKGFELTGDLRFSNNYYAAAELGYEDVLKTEDYLNYSTKGSFIKLGVNYNAYENWKGMNNQIYIGGRYAFSFFEHTLNSYTPNASGTYFIANPIEASTNFKDLNAHWLEFLFGMKVMSDALLKLAGNKMRSILATMTSNRFFMTTRSGGGEK